MPSQLGPEFNAWPPSAETVRCPFNYFETLREKAPVHRYPDASQFGPPLFVVTRWDDCVDVLLRSDTFVNSPAPDEEMPGFFHALEPVEPGVPSFYERENVFFADGDDHRIKRSWAWPLVSRKLLAAVRPDIELEVDRLIDAFAADGHCDFRAQFSNIMPTRMVRTVMGLPEKADPMIKRFSFAQEAVDNNPDPSEEQVREIRESWMDMMTITSQTLRARQKRPVEGDYVSILVQRQLERDGVLDVNTLAEHLTLSIFGAEHPMGGHLAAIVGRLGDDPDLQERVRHDRSLVRAVSNEALRIYSPLPWLFRRCAEDTILAGVEIPEGAMVLVSQVSGNYDADVFPEPEVFDIDRPNIERDHLTLGRGEHRCVGADMAQLQTEVAMNRILDRLGDIRLVEEKSDLTSVLSYGFRIPTSVHIAFRAID
jgi:cytochrome P450